MNNNAKSVIWQEKNYRHVGNVQEIVKGYRASCKCLYKGPMRDFRYKAIKDLIVHYEKTAAFNKYTKHGRAK